MDPYDGDYTLYEVFTREEPEEIKSYNHKPLPSPSTEFKRFLNSYNLDSCQKIRVALGQNHQFHADYDYNIDADKDWVHHVGHSLLKEYEFEDIVSNKGINHTSGQ